MEPAVRLGGWNRVAVRAAQTCAAAVNMAELAHEPGHVREKAECVDDFFGAAEYLIANKYNFTATTSPLPAVRMAAC